MTVIKFFSCPLHICYPRMYLILKNSGFNLVGLKKNFSCIKPAFDVFEFHLRDGFTNVGHWEVVLGDFLFLSRRTTCI